MDDNKDFNRTRFFFHLKRTTLKTQSSRPLSGPEKTLPQELAHKQKFMAHV